MSKRNDTFTEKNDQRTAKKRALIARTTKQSSSSLPPTQIANTKPNERRYSSTGADAIFALLQCLLIVVVGIIVFATGNVAEGLMIFGIAYCVLFYKLAMAGTHIIEPAPYVSGTSFLLAQQTRRPRKPSTKVKRARPRSRNEIETFSPAANVDDDFPWHSHEIDDDLQFLGFNGNTMTTVNPATGLVMLGAVVDCAGNSFGSSGLEDSLFGDDFCSGIDLIDDGCSSSTFDDTNSF